MKVLNPLDVWTYIHAEEPEKLAIELQHEDVMRLLELQVWVRYKRRKSEDDGRREMFLVDTDTDDPAEWKYLIADKLAPMLRRIDYYYVVAVVQKTDGTKGYRTIIPQTVPVLK